MPDPQDPIEEAWSTLEAHWDDLERHRAFLVLASTLERLPDAAARYKAALDDPARKEYAERGQKILVTHALARIDAAPRTTREEARKGGRVLAPLVALGSMLTLSYMLAHTTGARALWSIPAVVLEILFVALLPWRRLLR